MPLPMTDSRLYAPLAYAGALPFIACGVLPWVGVSVVPGLGSLAEIAATYGVAIASFMAGTHWGTYLYHAARAPCNLLLISNVVTLGVWLAYVLAPVAVSLAVTAVAFAALLLVDFALVRRSLLTAAYVRVRRNVTTVVLMALALTIAAL